MHETLISEVVVELRPKLTGRFLGKIFQLGSLSIAIDFGLKGEFLYVSVDPSRSRLFLIKRRLKELEKSSIPHQPFAQTPARQTRKRTIDRYREGSDRSNCAHELSVRRSITMETGRSVNGKGCEPASAGRHRSCCRRAASSKR